MLLNLNSSLSSLAATTRSPYALSRERERASVRTAVRGIAYLRIPNHEPKRKILPPRADLLARVSARLLAYWFIHGLVSLVPRTVPTAVACSLSAVAYSRRSEEAIQRTSVRSCVRCYGLRSQERSYTAAWFIYALRP